MRLPHLAKSLVFVTSLVCSCDVGCALAPRVNSGRFNKSVDAVFVKWAKPDSPGCALAVIKDGKVIYERGYGCANLESGAPITASSVFNIGSSSKQFTAMCVLLLAGEGKLSLDDDIRKYLPEIPDFGRTITIRHLVHHTSGLRDYQQLLAFAGWRDDDVITREHMLNMVCHQKELNFSPGDEYLYCNTGYCLLAEIVARVSGQSFAAFSAAHIFKPLGMTNTHVHDDYERIVKNRAHSYQAEADGTFKNALDNSSVVGGGGIYSTIEDLAKWVNNFDHGRVGGPPVLKQMHEQGVLNNGQTNGYAFGLFIEGYKGVKIVEHGGAFAGYRSDIIRFPDQRLAVILLGNTSAMDAAQLARQAADIFLFGAAAHQASGAQEEKLSSPPGTPLSPGDLEAFCGEYEFKPGQFGTITRDGNRLYAQSTGLQPGPRVELLPETENTFLTKEGAARITFQRDERGRVNRLVLDGRGGASIAQRIVSSRVPLRAEELAEYAGEYESDELGTAYRILVRNGELFAQHRRLGDIRLNQISVRDQFIGAAEFPHHFAFTRNARKHVDGFKLSWVRSRNLRFEKRSKALSEPSEPR